MRFGKRTGRNLRVCAGTAKQSDADEQERIEDGSFDEPAKRVGLRAAGRALKHAGLRNPAPGAPACEQGGWNSECDTSAPEGITGNAAVAKAVRECSGAEQAGLYLRVDRKRRRVYLTSGLITNGC